MNYKQCISDALVDLESAKTELIKANFATDKTPVDSKNVKHLISQAKDNLESACETLSATYWINN